MSRPRRNAHRQDSAHQLRMYALMAAASGVSLLATSQAQGEPVYTAADQKMLPNHDYPLDLNHDGVTDFYFHASFMCTSFCEYIEGGITIEPAHSSNEAWGFEVRDQGYAYALPPGTVIGPKGKFLAGNEIMMTGGYDAGTNSVGSCDGPWTNKQNAYLGLKFDIQGETHYGWARLSTTCLKNGESEAVLTGYAYESVANRPIEFHQPIRGVHP